MCSHQRVIENIYALTQPRGDRSEPLTRSIRAWASYPKRASRKNLPTGIPHQQLVHES